MTTNHKARHRRTGQTYTASYERCDAGCDHWHVHIPDGCAVIPAALFHNIYELVGRPTIDGQLSLATIDEGTR